MRKRKKPRLRIRNSMVPQSSRLDEPDFQEPNVGVACGDIDSAFGALPQIPTTRIPAATNAATKRIKPTT
jgi:hypothetical protein